MKEQIDLIIAVKPSIALVFVIFFRIAKKMSL